MNDLIPYIITIIGAVVALIGAGGLFRLLGRRSEPGDKQHQEGPNFPAPQNPKPLEDPDDRQTPKPARPDPAHLPDDDADALDKLSGWGDELLDE